jgi:hypothetical protein
MVKYDPRRKSTTSNERLYNSHKEIQQQKGLKIAQVK